MRSSGHDHVEHAASCEKPRLIVDISVLHEKDAGTGIQRVVRNVWTSLSALDLEDLEIVPLFARSDGNFHRADPDFLERGGDGPSADGQPFRARPGDSFLGLDFSPRMLPRCEIVLKDWRALGVSINLVVYDLLPQTNPQWFTRRGVRNYRRWLALLVRHADRALCISSHVARELEGVLRRSRRGPAKPSVGVLRIGSDFRHDNEMAPPLAVLAAQKGRDIILMVGTIEPRKGYAFALEVFDRLWRGAGDGPIVVIVGRPGWKTDRLQHALRSHPRAGRSFFWLDEASDRELAWLYVHSAVLFSATYAEGLGLPLKEARSCGLPVVATDLPVFHEFADEGIALFEIGDSARAAALLVEAMGKGHLAYGGANVGLQPSWADTAADILQQIGCHAKL